MSMLHTEENLTYMANKPQLSVALNKQDQEALQFQFLL